MALCVGGPFLVAGAAPDPVTIRGFQEVCSLSLNSLYTELIDSSPPQEDQTDDLCVDDLRVVSDAQLVEHAISQAPPLNPESKKKRCRKRKKQGNSEVGNKKRNSDRDTEDSDMNRIMFYQNLKKEREICRENAVLYLHSFNQQEDPKAKKLDFKNSSSVLKAPCRSYNDQIMQELPAWEVVLTVEFYTKGRKTQEFTVLGSQLLTSLRDQLYCLTDYVSPGVRSGYFLIENVFYNDMRHNEAVDYSLPVLNWLEANQSKRRKRKGRPLRVFRSARMEETFFRDLEIRLGVKYLYCHQGECRHALVFNDVRMIHNDDTHDAGAYPILKFVPVVRYKKCGICEVFRARKVTWGDEKVGISPCCFCDKCFEMLHGDGEGVTVCDYYHE